MTQSYHSLTALLRDLIQTTGPVSVSTYMALALGHPTFGYYRTRDPLGRTGDFITAPEISQMFGELLGIWAATVWQRFGQPTAFNLVEVGPGRGTLMADALRATRHVPGFHRALAVHLVETSPVLIQKQQDALDTCNIPVFWYTDINDIPADHPVCLIGNEFLDALPIRQVIWHNSQWRERLITWDHQQEKLAFCTADIPLWPQPALPDGVVGSALTDGDILEIPHHVTNVLNDLADLLQTSGGAALFIDYGHAHSGLGETFQALKDHHYAPVLDTPGEADLTAHVDFAHVARQAKQKGLGVHGAISQGQFLSAMGLTARAQHLCQAAPTEQARTDIKHAYQRLAGSDGMGRLFKAISLTSSDFGTPEGF